MGEPKQLGTVMAEAFVGRRVRFLDLDHQFDREEVHTVEKLLFRGYDTAEEEEDPGVEVHFITSTPGMSERAKVVVICGLSDRVEFVEGKEAKTRPSGAIGAPRSPQWRVLPEGEN
jgi:hypothetical protein